MISTVVFFDLETTGLPYQERNRTKIVETSFVAVTRHDIMRNQRNVQFPIPPISKLTIMLNPERKIQSAEITGVTDDMVKHLPTFKEKFNTIKAFLEDLSKPVCLVAHNGNAFDYKILLAECADADVTMPDDLMCGDSLPFFKSLFKKTVQKKNNNINNATHSAPVSASLILSQSPEITDDEDEWPELNVTPEEFQEIDDLCSSMSDKLNLSKDAEGDFFTRIREAPKSYKLVDIYRRLFDKEPQNAHRAEDDCFTLLQCILVVQNACSSSDTFLTWIDTNSKLLNQIKPLKRS